MLLWQTNTLYTSPAPLVCGGGEGSTRQTTANVGGSGRCMSPDDEASVASLSTVSDIHLKSRDEFNNQVSESGNGPFTDFSCLIVLLPAAKVLVLVQKTLLSFAKKIMIKSRRP